MTSVEPPDHVRATFGLREVTPVCLGNWDGGWRLGDVVLCPVAGRAPGGGGGGVRHRDPGAAGAGGGAPR
ncbi:hypothetical protein ACFWPJ_27585, partial [Nocardia sp. NPDC058497]